MQDFKVEQKTDTTFDLVVEDYMFTSVDTFETSIYYQLFLKKRSTKDQVSTPRERGGWMGDLITKPEYESGSYLYVKEQSRNTQADRNEIVEYVKLALKYFRQFGAKKITAESDGQNISGTITVDNDETIEYSSLWRIV